MFLRFRVACCAHQPFYRFRKQEPLPHGFRSAKVRGGRSHCNPSLQLHNFWKKTALVIVYNDSCTIWDADRPVNTTFSVDAAISWFFLFRMIFLQSSTSSNSCTTSVLTLLDASWNANITCFVFILKSCVIFSAHHCTRLPWTSATERSVSSWSHGSLLLTPGAASWD